jgi:predicted ABC-type ATPase
MQEIIIIAGPNGAGKTSFANEFLREHRKGLAFVNADEIARVMGDRDSQVRWLTCGQHARC